MFLTAATAVLFALSSGSIAATPPSASAVSEADKQAVIDVITDAYVNGVHAKPDAAAMRRGFHPDFRMLVLTDGTMSAVTLDEWAGRIEKTAANAKGPAPNVKAEFPVVEVQGTAASARVEIWRNGRHTFTDYLLLYKFADGWKIVGKTFYTHPTTQGRRERVKERSKKAAVGVARCETDLGLSRFAGRDTVRPSRRSPSFVPS